MGVAGPDWIDEGLLSAKTLEDRSCAGPEGSTQVLQRSSDWGCAGPPVLCSGPSLVF